MRVCAQLLSKIPAVNDLVQKKSKKQSVCFIEHDSWNSGSLHKIYGSWQRMNPTWTFSMNTDRQMQDLAPRLLKE